MEKLLGAAISAVADGTGCAGLAAISPIVILFRLNISLCLIFNFKILLSLLYLIIYYFA
jgi:hypothetical protein